MSDAHGGSIASIDSSQPISSRNRVTNREPSVIRKLYDMHLDAWHAKISTHGNRRLAVPWILNGPFFL